MKKKFTGIGVAVVALLLVVAYLRMDSSAPPGQEPLATLTAANFPVFQETFDRSIDRKSTRLNSSHT